MRQAQLERNTGETQIKVLLNLDQQRENKINTGVGFLDHMLNLMARHGFFSLDVEAAGDLKVDDHHTVEDIGITLGLALKEALGDKAGINRYGTSYVPMDETLARVVLDLSNRPYLVFKGEIPSQKVGSFDTELVEEFLRAFAFNAGITLHVHILEGRNSHHIIEAVFKALGRALKEASTVNNQVQGVLSTKGIL